MLVRWGQAVNHDDTYRALEHLALASKVKSEFAGEREEQVQMLVDAGDAWEAARWR